MAPTHYAKTSVTNETTLRSLANTRDDTCDCLRRWRDDVIEKCIDGSDCSFYGLQNYLGSVPPEYKDFANHPKLQIGAVSFNISGIDDPTLNILTPFGWFSVCQRFYSTIVPGLCQSLGYQDGYHLDIAAHTVSSLNYFSTNCAGNGSNIIRDCGLNVGECSNNFAATIYCGNFSTSQCRFFECKFPKICMQGTCECANGYALDAQGNCTDINECLNTSACNNTQNCINLNGSFFCRNAVRKQISANSSLTQGILLSLVVNEGATLLNLLQDKITVLNNFTIGGTLQVGGNSLPCTRRLQHPCCK